MTKFYDFSKIVLKHVYQQNGQLLAHLKHFWPKNIIFWGLIAQYENKAKIVLFFRKKTNFLTEFYEFSKIVLKHVNSQNGQLLAHLKHFWQKNIIFWGLMAQCGPDTSFFFPMWRGNVKN